MVGVFLVGRRSEEEGASGGKKSLGGQISRILDGEPEPFLLSKHFDHTTANSVVQSLQEGVVRIG